MSPYNGMGNNPILYSDPMGDTLRLNFLGTYSQWSENQLSGVANRALEGQFRVVYSDVEYDENNEIASGNLVIVPTEGGGDLSKMSLNGQEFHRQLTEITEETTMTEVNVDAARADVHTGKFEIETIDMADVLQWSSDVTELGGTQAGKLIHEFTEQNRKQTQGEPFQYSLMGPPSAAHGAGIQAENNVNLSTRRDKPGGTQTYSAGGRTVTQTVGTQGRVIKIKQ